MSEEGTIHAEDWVCIQQESDSTSLSKDTGLQQLASQTPKQRLIRNHFRGGRLCRGPHPLHIQQVRVWVRNSLLFKLLRVERSERHPGTGYYIANYLSILRTLQVIYLVSQLAIYTLLLIYLSTYFTETVK